METIRFLGADDAPALLEAFNRAFADYAVDVRMDEARFRDLLARRAVRLDLSVGAFADGRIVAFLANGFAPWRGAPAAYDSGTGVVPGFRGRGLAARTFDFAAPRLVAEGARRYVLEVLVSNEPALRIYRAKGFAPTRRLLCFEAEPATIAARPAAGVVVREAPGLDAAFAAAGVVVREAPGLDAAFAAAAGDFAPSWQNTPDALARSLAPRTTLEAFVDGRRAGCAVVVPATGDTIASSRCAKALIRVDFPALGGPAITTDSPSAITSAAGRANHAPSSAPSSAIPSIKRCAAPS